MRWHLLLWIRFLVYFIFYISPYIWATTICPTKKAEQVFVVLRRCTSISFPINDAARTVSVGTLDYSRELHHHSVASAFDFVGRFSQAWSDLQSGPQLCGRSLSVFTHGKTSVAFKNVERLWLPGLVRIKKNTQFRAISLNKQTHP